MKVSVVAVVGVLRASALVGVTVAGCHSGSTSSPASSGSAASARQQQLGVQFGAGPASRLHRTADQGHRYRCTRSLHGEPANPESQWQGRCGGVVQQPRRHTRDRRYHPGPAGSFRCGRRARCGEDRTRGAVTGTPGPSDIGTGGTTVSGNSPDGSKSVTVLLFTQGRAFTTLEFDGPANAAVPPDFVTDVGQKQLTAIQNGLPN